jgi:cytochrome c
MIRRKMEAMTRNRLTLPAMAFLLAACDDQSTSEALDEALYMQGEIVFERLCSTCHDERARAHKVGPYLVGLMGRRAGSVSGFNYSPAMRALDVEWGADALDAFLVDPTTTVPGTMMVIEPVDDPAERAALIYYLTQQ